MPDPDHVGCLPSEARNSKLCDAVVADNLSLTLFLSLCVCASSGHFPAPGIPPRRAHLTLKGHPVSCDANDAQTTQESSRFHD